MECPITQSINYLGGLDAPVDDSTNVFGNYVCDGVAYYHAMQEILFARAKAHGNLTEFCAAMNWISGPSDHIARKLSRRLLPIEVMWTLSNVYSAYVNEVITPANMSAGVSVAVLNIPERRCAIETPDCVIALAKAVSEWTGIPPPAINISQLEQFEIAPINATMESVEEFQRGMRKILEWLREYEKLYCELCNYILRAIESKTTASEK